MKIIYPEYFTGFRCSAGECIDTCCAGWEIVVDAESEKKYRAVKGAFGEKLRRLMTEDADGDLIFSSENGRCPFLNEKNLCDIYINCGEDYLCTTCRMFPRFVEEFGDERELGLGLGCPEAAEIILSQTGPWSFIGEQNNENPLYDDIDSRLYTLLKTLRKKIFEIIFRKDLSVECALSNVLMLSEQCQYLIDDELYDEAEKVCAEFEADKSAKIELLGQRCGVVLGKFEILSDSWRDVLGKLDCDSDTYYSEEYRNIAAYYIYRYFLKASFDYDIITKVRMCAFSCEVISRAEKAGLSLSDAARMYSKEAEYSAENIEILYNLL